MNKSLKFILILIFLVFFWKEQSFAQDSYNIQFGLVPCGRTSDHPATSWDETEYCQFKHFFVLLKNILDFILWRLGLIALVFLMIVTFAVSYFSLGSPNVMVKIKSIWTSAGQGYAILFFGWIILNLILRALGFTDTWWTITF